MKKYLFKFSLVIILVLSMVISLSSCGLLFMSHGPINNDGVTYKTYEGPNETIETLDVISYEELLANIPQFTDKPYVVINNNKPFFTADEITSQSFESYSKLDTKDRCGVCMASIGIDLMPTEDRGSIGSVRPTGWHTVKYSIVDGQYLYNRCHLIGFQLTGENANKQNLITGTRYLNIDGMLDFEDMVADYVKETCNHVMYRVTPIYEGDNLLASGVLMEGYSVEDDGYGICFCIYAYNAQPGITIDYRTGESWLSTEEHEESDPTEESTDIYEGQDEIIYVINTSTKKIHKSSCRYADLTSVNCKEYSGYIQDLLESGYVPCSVCKPEE